MHCHIANVAGRDGPARRSVSRSGRAPRACPVDPEPSALTLPRSRAQRRPRSDHFRHAGPASIGEPHFARLAVSSCPDLRLSSAPNRCQVRAGRRRSGRDGSSGTGAAGPERTPRGRPAIRRAARPPTPPGGPGGSRACPPPRRGGGATGHHDSFAGDVTTHKAGRAALAGTAGARRGTGGARRGRAAPEGDGALAGTGRAGGEGRLARAKQWAARFTAGQPAFRMRSKPVAGEKLPDQTRQRAQRDVRPVTPYDGPIAAASRRGRSIRPAWPVDRHPARMAG